MSLPFSRRLRKVVEELLRLNRKKGRHNYRKYCILFTPIV